MTTPHTSKTTTTTGTALSQLCSCWACRRTPTSTKVLAARKVKW